MDNTTPPTWDEYHRIIAGIAAEMRGALSYYDNEGTDVTDAQAAGILRRYVARMDQIEPPS